MCALAKNLLLPIVVQNNFPLSFLVKGCFKTIQTSSATEMLLTLGACAAANVSLELSTSQCALTVSVSTTIFMLDGILKLWSMIVYISNLCYDLSSSDYRDWLGSMSPLTIWEQNSHYLSSEVQIFKFISFFSIQGICSDSACILYWRLMRLHPGFYYILVLHSNYRGNSPKLHPCFS